MNNKVIIKYTSETKYIEIESDGRCFPTERISGIDISELAYPFIVNNNRWNGLYEELKNFYGKDTFSVVFHGSDKDLALLKQIFTGKPVNVIGLNNTVVILYDSNQLSTKITVNGKIFDTSKLINRSIDEWVLPFAYKDTEWKGIFAEIEDYLGINTYSIRFVGKLEDMYLIMDNCPENIDITYRVPIVQKNTQCTEVSKVDNTITTKVDSAPKQEKQSIKPDTTIPKTKTKGFIRGIKNDYLKMKENDSGLLLYGKIALAVALVGCVIFVFILMSRLFMLISLVPAIVFAILAFKGKYKNIGIATLILCLILAIASWVIITIRWTMFWSDLGSDLDDAFDESKDALDAIREANDIINS